MTRIFDMKYSDVKLLQSFKQCYNLLIDNKLYIYDIYFERKETVFGRDNTYYILPTILELNKENPKETLDEFFKLLPLN
jgi:hypothetical protein